MKRYLAFNKALNQDNASWEIDNNNVIIWPNIDEMKQYQRK